MCLCSNCFSPTSFVSPLFFPETTYKTSSVFVCVRVSICGISDEKTPLREVQVDRDVSSEPRADHQQPAQVDQPSLTLIKYTSINQR